MVYLPLSLPTSSLYLPLLSTYSLDLLSKSRVLGLWLVHEYATQFRALLLRCMATHLIGARQSADLAFDSPYMVPLIVRVCCV